MSGVVRIALRQWQPCRSLQCNTQPFSALRGIPSAQAQASVNFLYVQRRLYVSKNKKSKGKGRDEDDANDSPTQRAKRKSSNPENFDRRGTGTADVLVPGSERVNAGEAYSAADARMKTATDWLKRTTAQLEQQGAGRVTPDVLRPVRVAMPDGSTQALVELATVGVRDGTTLVVTVFTEEVRIQRSYEYAKELTVCFFD